MSLIDVLVIAAHPPALIGLRDHLGQALHGSAFGLNVSAKVCGVGIFAVRGCASATLVRSSITRRGSEP